MHPRPELSHEFVAQSLRELSDFSESVAVVSVTDQRRKQMSVFDFRISTVKVASVLKGSPDVGDVVDVRQNGFPAGTEGGEEVEHGFLVPGRTYTLFLRDAGIANDEDRPFFHVFGVFEHTGDELVDLSIVKTLPPDERAVTSDEMRRIVQAS